MDKAAALATAKCCNHPSREAVCRCTGCSQAFCRECVVDHDGRMVCTECLRALERTAPVTGITSVLRTMILSFCGAMLVWFSFYLIGRVLLLLPASFDEWGSL